VSVGRVVLKEEECGARRKRARVRIGVFRVWRGWVGWRRWKEKRYLVWRGGGMVSFPVISVPWRQASRREGEASTLELAAQE
jgi:hypothetical protein